MTTILEHIADEVGKQIKAERATQGGNLTADINSIIELIKNGGLKTEVVANNLAGKPYMTHSVSSSSSLLGTAGAVMTHTSMGGFQTSRLVSSSLPTWDRSPSATNPSFLDHLNDQGKMLNKTFVKNHVVTIQNNGVDDVFFIDGVEQPTLEFAKGNQYIFDWSDDLTNPLRLSEVSDGTHSTGSEHTNGIVVDLVNGTTTFTIVDDEVDSLFYYSDATSGLGGEIVLKIPPYHTSMNDGHLSDSGEQNNVGLLVNMLKEGVSRRTAPTDKILYICDTPPSDYMFYVRGGFIQFQLEMACYWAGLTLEIPSGSQVVTRQPSDFYNARYDHLAPNITWFYGNHYGYVQHDQFFLNNNNISSVTDWANYFSDYDSVVFLGISKTKYFPSNAINGLAKARDENAVGVIGITDDAYYTRNINSVFAPYNISFVGRFSQLNTSDHYLVSNLKAQGFDHNYLFDNLHDDYHLNHTITDSYVSINEENANSHVTINLEIDNLRSELTNVSEYSPAVDTEFRNLNRSIAGNATFPVEQGDVINITSINPSKIIWQNENGVFRQLLHSQEGTIYRRMDSSVSFADEYDENLSTIGTGAYSITAQIEILSSGNHVTGWLDLYDLEQRVKDSAGTIGQSLEADLPLPLGDGEIFWVIDQDFHVYSKDGDWYKMSDDSLFKNLATRDIDMYLLLGQSNMHGHADLAGASADITDSKTDVLFRTAWHHETGNADSDLYESDWVDNVNAGDTRGDDGVSTIGGSSKFGPEIGFAHEGKTNGLFGTNTPAIFKYAVGASTLFSGVTDSSGNDLSDWDTDPNLTGREGDCWRGFKESFDNAIDALQAKGHRVFIKDVIWYQGESDGANAGTGVVESKLKVLWDKIRNHFLTKNISYSNTNIVVTRISGSNGDPVNWGDEYKRFSDKYSRAGLVDATIYSPGNSVHLDQDGMFNIGKAFAREAKRINTLSSHSIPHEIPGTDLVNAVSATESTITKTSGFVTQVDDLSSNGNNYTADSSSTIELVESGSDLLYNEKVFKFDGDTDVLDTGNITGLDLGSKFTCYMLFNPSVNGGQDAPWSIRDFSNFDVIAPLSGNSSEYRGQFYHHTRTQGAVGHTGTTAITGWNLLTWEIDTTAQTSTAWLNGTQLFSFADSGTLGADSIIHLMGNHNAPSTQTGASVLDGKFTEFIITKDNSDREKVEGAIMHKYGLARNLPANHAYKEIVP